MPTICLSFCIIYLLQSELLNLVGHVALREWQHNRASMLTSHAAWIIVTPTIEIIGSLFQFWSTSESCKNPPSLDRHTGICPSHINGTRHRPNGLAMIFYRTKISTCEYLADKKISIIAVKYLSLLSQSAYKCDQPI